MLKGFHWLSTLISAGCLTWPSAAARAEDPAAERGAKALLGRAFNGLIWSSKAYANSWRQWPGAVKDAAPPAPETIRERYGLSVAPYPNGDLPMGIRTLKGTLFSGLTTDCMLCHGGSIADRSYVGLGNASLDMQGIYEDLAAADGRSPRTPFIFSNVRGTTEAGAMAVFLISWREPNLRLRSTQLQLGFRDDVCEDAPAWWLLKKKKSMYYTGSSDAHSVRSLMQFMLSPLNSAAAIKQEESTFQDIQAFLLSIQPPPYPFAIDRALAEQGENVFRTNCARCHGTYGKEWTYPNKIVPIDVIGTDRTRFDGFTRKSGEYYNQSWFAHEKAGWLIDDYPVVATPGYQAPPLDGIWATAPYLHNGSVPTVYHLLNSQSRPALFTRSYRTDQDAYDPVKLGWKIEDLKPGAADRLPPYERRKVYDTSQPGRWNGGHRFGDKLTEEKRWAVIEYLKTL
jgi:mono/diheme cytochrome c family protein